MSDLLSIQPVKDTLGPEMMFGVVALAISATRASFATIWRPKIVCDSLDLVRGNAIRYQVAGRCDWLQHMLSRVESLNELNADWSGYGVANPSVAAIYNASEFLRACDRANFEPSRVSPSVEEGVTASFFSAKNSAAFEFSNDGEITAVITDGCDFIDAWSVPLEELDASIQRAFLHMHS